jgi:hypothetical protein
LRDLGERYNEATILGHLGDSQHAAGNPQAARDAYQQALSILEDLDHPTPTASGRSSTTSGRPRTAAAGRRNP